MNEYVRNPRYCLQCDDGTILEYGAKDVHDSIHGEAFTVRAVKGWHCPKCGEIEFVDGDAERYSDALEAASEAYEKRRATEIKAIRKKLGLTQAEAGKLFGGGATAFSEYEHCKTEPHKSTVLLLRVLGRHPELLSELVEEPHPA
ncbi:MAG: type II toxin-antitoxin system MqsA family antitoxin [Zoogloeaceae bacterium]|jgi:HTH-type transcriptional regulator/antitoxin MqsA|nr:type II toxin-antitoxin system MqsA family antitoxin [Zoogloeaceae bacterium]